MEHRLKCLPQYYDDVESGAYILAGPRFGVSAGYVVMALEPLP